LKPCLPNAQVAPNFGDSHLQNFGGVLCRHTSEESHFDQLRLYRVFPCQLYQRVVKGNQGRRPFYRQASNLIKRHLGSFPTAFFSLTRARVVDQDLAHDVRRHPHEMRAAVVIGLILPYEPGIGFVDQGGRLQSVAGTLIPHVAPRQPSQFGVHQRYQTIKSVLIPCRDLMQESRNGLIFRQAATLYPRLILGRCLMAPGRVNPRVDDAFTRTPLVLAIVVEYAPELLMLVTFDQRA
jgi:hypothetical protein